MTPRATGWTTETPAGAPAARLSTCSSSLPASVRAATSATSRYLQRCERLRVGCACVRMLSEFVRVHHHLQLAKRLLQQWQPLRSHKRHAGSNRPFKWLARSSTTIHHRGGRVPAMVQRYLPQVAYQPTDVWAVGLRVWTHRLRRRHVAPAAPPPALGETPRVTRQRP
jgi:hypothetical protein